MNTESRSDCMDAQANLFTAQANTLWYKGLFIALRKQLSFGSAFSNRAKENILKFNPRAYHRPMKLNRAFIRNPGNGYL